MTETRPEVEVDAGDAGVTERLVDRSLRVLLDLRVPVHAGRLDDGRSRDAVELAHEILGAEMEVDGALVHRGVRSLALDQAENRPRRRVDDRERIAVAGTEREPPCWGVATLPDEPGGRSLELGKHACSLERLRAECRHVALGDRALERRGADMRVEDAMIRVVEPRRLDTAREQGLGLAHEELVECVLACDEHGEAVLAPAGAPPLLA